MVERECSADSWVLSGADTDGSQISARQHRSLHAPFSPRPHWRTQEHAAHRDEGYALPLNLALVRRLDALCRERGIASAATPSRTQSSGRRARG